MWREFQVSIVEPTDLQFKVAGDGDYNMLTIDNGYLETSDNYESLLTMDTLSREDIEEIRDALSAYLRSLE